MTATRTVGLTKRFPEKTLSTPSILPLSRGNFCFARCSVICPSGKILSRLQRIFSSMPVEDLYYCRWDGKCLTNPKHKCTIVLNH